MSTFSLFQEGRDVRNMVYYAAKDLMAVLSTTACATTLATQLVKCQPRHDTKEHAGFSSSSILKCEVVYTNWTSIPQMLWALCKELTLRKPQKTNIVYHHSTLSSWAHPTRKCPRKHRMSTRRIHDEARYAGSTHAINIG